MKLIEQAITIEVLKQMAEQSFGDFVKAVVDIEQRIMVVDAMMHADEEKYLLEKGSAQENLWGVNLYPDFEEDRWIEFDSMINLRPSFGNNTRSIDDKKIQDRVIEVIKQLVKR